MPADISIELIKALRDKTGAGMMDCKKALQESQASMDKAEDWLRKKGMAQASKKSAREAGEGVVAIHVAQNGLSAAMVEINSETDFVARNTLLQTYALSCAQLAVETSCTQLERLTSMQRPDSAQTVAEGLMELTASVGENLVLARLAYVAIDKGKVGRVFHYLHNKYADNIGRIGVLLVLEGEGVQSCGDVGKSLAMHVAASAPLVVSRETLPGQWLERERAIMLERDDVKAKPPAIAQTMVEGLLRKRYQDVVLLEQLYVMDGKTPISRVLEQAGGKNGMHIADSVRFALGERQGA
ncbi:MAG: translation elongation factor Ts [Alphaproteobacteria bacterium GM7ARS4]|nr:translation elongation factor Ts [Alphaproteobacteria bacterium GM7ARS4]